MSTEQRDQMAATFVAVRDALLRSVVPTYQVHMDSSPRLPRPSYLPAAPDQTASQYHSAIRKLAGLGIVRKADA